MRWPGWMIGEVLRHALDAPATVAYPAVPVRMPEDFRGRIRFLSERCVGCRLCEKDCPSGAISIEKVGDKRFQAVIELDRCIFCAQCVESCNKDALESTPEFELAVLDRKQLRVVFAAPEALPAPPAPPPAPKPPAAG